MSEAKHTPGPWRWVYADADCKRPIALEGPDHDVILASEDFIGPRAYVTEADANMIEAVPDLFEACEEVLMNLDYLRAIWGDEGVTRTVADAVRAAVAKAKGGQP